MLIVLPCMQSSMVWSTVDVKESHTRTVSRLGKAEMIPDGSDAGVKFLILIAIGHY